MSTDEQLAAWRLNATVDSLSSAELANIAEECVPALVDEVRRLRNEAQRNCEQCFSTGAAQERIAIADDLDAHGTDLCLDCGCWSNAAERVRRRGGDE